MKFCIFSSIIYVIICFNAAKVSYGSPTDHLYRTQRGAGRLQAPGTNLTIEFLIVNDYELWKKWFSEDTPKLVQFNLQVAQQVSLVFKKLGIDVVLFATEVWKDEPFNKLSTLRKLATEFAQYNAVTYKKKYRHDITHMITGYTYEGVSSEIYGKPCGDFSIAVHQFAKADGTGRTANEMAAIIAHNLGLNLGLEVDRHQGCDGVMSVPVTETQEWSSCAIKKLISLRPELAKCLANDAPPVCPDNCNAQGACKNGVCFCHVGYAPPSCKNRVTTKTPITTTSPTITVVTTDLATETEAETTVAPQAQENEEPTSYLRIGFGIFVVLVLLGIVGFFFTRSNSKKLSANPVPKSGESKAKVTASSPKKAQAAKPTAKAVAKPVAKV
ncbi:Zinc metalloproteinase-disintegrin stejnitin [Halotydeus destructor]|nr:Zinc metalloproteinase-disintegrin stejnitin [Halotydeus destructor]